MKTFRIEIKEESNYEKVITALRTLESEGIIKFEETRQDTDEAEPATEDQVQEIIAESELGPYYSEKEAKEILNL
jgi:hypothetical protein